MLSYVGEFHIVFKQKEGYAFLCICLDFCVPQFLLPLCCILELYRCCFHWDLVVCSLFLEEDEH